MQTNRGKVDMNILNKGIDQVLAYKPPPKEQRRKSQKKEKLQAGKANKAQKR